MNSETELRYPVNFTAEKRRVFLKGEAYFEVAKNAQIPFVVTTSAGIDVKVLGTKFNVASYENDEQVTTTLAEGSVEVGDEKGSVRLKPEEQALSVASGTKSRCRYVSGLERREVYIRRTVVGANYETIAALV